VNGESAFEGLENCGIVDDEKVCMLTGGKKKIVPG
jgi:hypothetical protein